jgi:acyl-CoA dehydrogenase
MSWDFSTDADYQGKLDWADRLATEEIQSLDLVHGGPYDKSNQNALARRTEARRRLAAVQDLAAAHL